jgi:hypothetical protein
MYGETRYAVDLVRANPAGIGYLLKERITLVEQVADGVCHVAVAETHASSRSWTSSRQPRTTGASSLCSPTSAVSDHG